VVFILLDQGGPEGRSKSETEVAMKTEIALMLATTVLACSATECVVEATKDTFARSNDLHRNSGANPRLLILQQPICRTLIGFDLSSATNEIVSAELQFLPAETVERSGLDLTVCPLVQTSNNAAWGEGRGNLVEKGHPAQQGEATMTRSASFDVPWESAPGKTVAVLADSKLWLSPLAQPKNLAWTEGEWVKVPLKNIALLETIRKSDIQMLTLGLWGTSGRGFYHLYSKESGHAPKLVLQLKDEPKKPE
jgi:hypothetical protein